MSLRSASAVSNSLTSEAHSSVTRGEHLALGLLDEHLERDLLARALAEALGEVGVELEDVAGALAVELGVELGHHQVADPTS